ncbi:MAG: sigma-70 family RNA polymerase sigma factor [Acidobacteria bacterium]|nr:sigma-70 family RNA polymerase sigma factor [Acidobacteriota bacterium]
MALQTAAPDVAAVLGENRRRFLTFLSRRVPTREIAEDILQEAFVRGLTRAPALTTNESVMAWFYRVLRNAIVDHYRQTGAEARAMERYAAEVDDVVAPLDTELMEVLCGCVQSLVTTLKPEYATAITRVELEGASLAAFAKDADISPNNAGVRLHRARRALRARVIEVCSTCAEDGCDARTCGPRDVESGPCDPPVATRSAV